MGCLQSNDKIGIQHAYVAPGDDEKMIISFQSPKTHNPKEELAFVSGQDQKRFNIGDECYLIQAEWLQQWLDFATGKSFPPGSISNKSLLNGVGDSTNPSLIPKRDYRPVSKLVWEYLFKLYGGGPVVTLRGKFCFVLTRLAVKILFIVCFHLVRR
jgi:hypothetical protein